MTGVGSAKAANWACKASGGNAPTTRSTTSPFLKNNKVGTPLIPNRSASPNSSSTFTLTTLTRPAKRLASSSKRGAIHLHGPHQVGKSPPQPARAIAEQLAESRIRSHEGSMPSGSSCLCSVETSAKRSPRDRPPRRWLPRKDRETVERVSRLDCSRGRTCAALRGGVSLCRLAASLLLIPPARKSYGQRARVAWRPSGQASGRLQQESCQATLGGRRCSHKLRRVIGRASCWWFRRVAREAVNGSGRRLSQESAARDGPGLVSKPEGSSEV